MRNRLGDLRKVGGGGAGDVELGHVAVDIPPETGLKAAKSPGGGGGSFMATFFGQGTVKQSEFRIRENLANTLMRKFGDVCKDYQREQQRYKSEIQKAVFRSAILKGAADPIKSAYADVADKYQGVLKLEPSPKLHQMFLDFALLTEQQGELLDQIEYQVKSAGEYIEDSNTDIQYAISTRRR
ncbi:SNAP receptor [Aureococcus anophagefferens]|nr:SNAP receptor [Aureococcus anophagefferens]